MKEKFLGPDSIKPTREEKLHMWQWFKLQISTATFLRGNISLDRYIKNCQKKSGYKS